MRLDRFNLEVSIMTTSRNYMLAKCHLYSSSNYQAMSSHKCIKNCKKHQEPCNIKLLNQINTFKAQMFFKYHQNLITQQNVVLLHLTIISTSSQKPTHVIHIILLSTMQILRHKKYTKNISHQINAFCSIEDFLHKRNVDVKCMKSQFGTSDINVDA